MKFQGITSLDYSTFKWENRLTEIQTNAWEFQSPVSPEGKYDSLHQHPHSSSRRWDDWNKMNLIKKAAGYQYRNGAAKALAVS